MNSCLLTNLLNTRILNLHYNSNAEFDISNCTRRPARPQSVFFYVQRMNVFMGRLWGTTVRCFLVDGISTRKRLTNFFDMEWLGLNVLGETMQAFFALCGGARNNAPIFKIHTPFMEIRHARRLLSNAVTDATKIMHHDVDQAEKLILHALKHDGKLQDAVNRVMVATLMRDVDFAPMIAKHKIIEMQTVVNSLHRAFHTYRCQNNLKPCELSREICLGISMAKDHLKDARKAVV